jgi:4-diphosphocytidyl-2-C-methyl-D-erythritol kinase
MRLLSPAKINLFLYVTGKRPDGYHSVQTLMCGIGLSDEIFISFGKEQTTCECNHPGVPSGSANIAHRAAELFLTHMRKIGDGCRESVAISIEKRIPVGAGLGGGSSNAASVLLGLNRHYGHPLPKETLLAMGASLGADVPFFIYGRSAIARGIGNILEPAPPIRPFKVVLVYPGVAVSTASVYKNLNLGLTNHEKENRKILFNKNTFDPVAHLHNDLEAAATMLCPDIGLAKEALLAVEADGVLMSGSGSAVFGVFFDDMRAVTAERSLSRRSGAWRVFLTDVTV